MNVLLFYHSLVSDWNHGNAHFLRGIAAELMARGHDVTVLEPEDAWSRRQLEAERGPEAVASFERRFPALRSVRYGRDESALQARLAEADLVLVHEWNDAWLLAAIATHRAQCGRCRVLFHDTHHRAVTDPRSIATETLRGYDGVLAFGRTLKAVYDRAGWGRRAFVWHEAADTRVFFPRPAAAERRDLVFVGNWGDDERAAELQEFLFDPVKRLGLGACVYGVRYPEAGARPLRDAGIEHGGWVPNYEVPEVYAAFRATIHVPRRPYVHALAGIPTIRPFEALACGIPLVSAPWRDVEGLFAAGRDYLAVEDGHSMERALQDVLSRPSRARELAEHGLATIRRRHTCAHRVDELLEIVDELGRPRERTAIA